MALCLDEMERPLSLSFTNDGDWVRTFLELPITYPPGTHFLYNTGASFMLSAILQALTGQTLLDYLQPRLFEPLLMAQPVWESNPHGINLGGTGLRLTTMDVAKFGQLYLQRDLWHGHRIVPEAWIEEATSMQIASGNDPNSDWTQGYGFQFWRCRHQAYRGDGAFGQFCIVLPKQQVVLAMTSGTSNMQGILNVVWDHLLPGLHTQPLPERADEAQALKERLAHLSLPLPEALSADPSLAAQVSGRSIHLEANAWHLKEMAFTFDEDGSTFRMQDDRGAHHVITCGRTDWRMGEPMLIALLSEFLPPRMHPLERERGRYHFWRIKAAALPGEWERSNLTPVLSHALEKVWRIEQADQVDRKYVWHSYQDELVYAPGRMEAFGALTGFSLPRTRLQLWLVLLACGSIQTRERYGDLLTQLQVNQEVKRKVARVLEQRFGLSKEEQHSALEHYADAYFHRLEWG